MSRTERITEELDVLKRKYDNYFRLFLLVLSGTGITLYAVMVGEQPLYVVFASVLLVISTFVIMDQMRKVNKLIDDRLDELEKL